MCVCVGGGGGGAHVFLPVLPESPAALKNLAQPGGGGEVGDQIFGSSIPVSG